MTRHEDTVRLRHMLEHAREAVELTEGKSRADLDSDRTLELALTRLVEIVGEAAARVTPQTQERCQQVPWPDIVGLRNRLVHGYDSVDLDILWAIIRDDLPPLIATLEDVLDEEG
ncbi:MAG: DUF86 domain-containing protein [Planctomycetota bacterium]